MSVMKMGRKIATSTRLCASWPWSSSRDDEFDAKCADLERRTSLCEAPCGSGVSPIRAGVSFKVARLQWAETVSLPSKRIIGGLGDCARVVARRSG
jgi:hypothetical protein